MSEGRLKCPRSDVEKANPGSTDMEIIIVELGLYDHITTGRHMLTHIITISRYPSMFEFSTGELKQVKNLS